jgi:hypothetical protein
MLLALTIGWGRAAFVQKAAELCIRARQSSFRKDVAADMAALLEQYQSSNTAPGANTLCMSPDEFDALGDPNAPGYEWAIEDLNQSLGPMRPGYYILIPGRPEIGKTSFVLDQVLHMLPQADTAERIATVLIVNNEEHRSRLYTRALSNIFRRSARDIATNWRRAVQAAQNRPERWPERLLIEDCHGWSKEDITALIDRVAPQIVVLHRIDKIDMGKDIDGEAQLAAASFWARSVATKGRAVFGVCQAGDAAIGKLFLDEADIFGSRTRLQSETDAILLIGAESPDTPRRGLTITRNKLPGGPRSDDDKRYARCEVAFDRVTGHFTSLAY